MDVIERALKLAYTAHYSMSNDDVSLPTEDKIVSFILAQAYAMNEVKMQEDEDAPSLRLHMNVIFILMFGARSPDGNPSVLKVRTVLSNILSAMEPGTE